MQQVKKNIRVQQLVVFVAILFFIIKMVAYYLTQSVAVLTDALESTVNVIAGFITLYSLRVASKPRDEDHPYGHGKAEYLSAAVEGALITMAGFIIIYEAIMNFIRPHAITQLSSGIILIAITAFINFLVGFLCIRQGKKNNSPALIASGKHLQSDTYSTVGVITGLVLIYITGYVWIDSVVAFIFAGIVIYTGYNILRISVAGIMDEADKKLLNRMITSLNTNRRENWIDLHNLRVIKNGSILHIDCHLTIPWYLNVREAHTEIELLSELIKKEFGESLELFVHTDPCLEFSCRICTKRDCTVRQHPNQQKITWTLENVVPDKKHHLS